MLMERKVLIGIVLVAVLISGLLLVAPRFQLFFTVQPTPTPTQIPTEIPTQIEEIDDYLDTLPPLLPEVGREEIDFTILNKVHYILKEKSVFKEMTEDPGYLLRSAVKNIFAFLAVPQDQIPPWAWEIVEKELAKGQEIPDYSCLNEIVYRLSQDPKYADLNDPLRKEELLRAAIGDGEKGTGLIGALGDPFASYIPARNYKLGQMQREAFLGKYIGLGITLNKNDQGYFVITEVFEGSPAQKAGLKEGDWILAIDDHDPRGCTTYEVIMYTKSSGEGVPIKFLIKTTEIVTEGEKKIIKEVIKEITVIRGVVKRMFVFSVPGVYLPNGRGNTGDQKYLPFILPLRDRNGNVVEDIVYIKITEFTIQMAQDLAIVLTTIDLEKYQGIIIDLRENPGGILGSVVMAIDMFLPEKVTFYQEKNASGIVTKYGQDNIDLVPPEIPVVILISGETKLYHGTYSAAELFAAALRDHGRATLIGEKTGGKGTVNQVIPLEGGDYGALYIAIKLWLTPSGQQVEREDRDKDGIFEIGGIEPDIPVSWSPEDYKQHDQDINYDPQLFEAIDYLRGKQ